MLRTHQPRLYDTYYVLFFLLFLWCPHQIRGTTESSSDLRKIQTEIIIYGSPTTLGGLDSSYGFSILDPLQEAWTRFARGYAVDLWKENAALYLDNDHFLYYGTFDLFNYTFVGGILQFYPDNIYRDDYDIEPSWSSLGMGVVGNGVDNILVTQSNIILVGFFAYFAANITTPVINIGACSTTGTNCFQVADGLLDYGGHGEIFYVNNNYYVSYQADMNTTTWKIKHIPTLQSQKWNLVYSDQVNMMDAIQIGDYLVVGSIKIVSNSSTNGTRHRDEFFEYSEMTNETQTFNITISQIDVSGNSQLLYSELWEAVSTPFINFASTTGQDLYLRWSNLLLRYEVGDLVPIYSYDGNCDANQISDNYITTSNGTLFLYCQGAVVQYSILQNVTKVVQHLQFSECPNFLVNNSKIFLPCDGQMIYMNLETDFIDSYQSNTSLFQFQDIQLCPLVSELVVIGQFDQIGLVNIDKTYEDLNNYQTALWDKASWSYLSPTAASFGYSTCAGHYSTIYIASVNTSTSPLMVTKLLDEYPAETWYYPKETSVRLSARTPLVITTNGNQAFIALNSFNYSEVIMYDPETNYSAQLFTIEGGEIETMITASSNNSNTTYLIIGGNFHFTSEARNLTFGNAARFNLGTNQWEYFDSIGTPSLSNFIFSSALANSTVYLSGTFTEVIGNPMLINNVVGCNVDSGHCFDNLQGGVPSSTNITSLVYDGDKTLYFIPFVCGEDTWHRSFDDLTRALLCQNLYAFELGGVVPPQLFKPSVSAVGANKVGIYVNPQDDTATKYWILILMSGVCFGAIFCVVIVYVYFYLKRPRYLELTAIDEHDIDFSNEYFELTVELGQGKFGQTWTCELPYHSTKRKFAVKMIMLPLEDPQRIATFEKILSNLQKLRHQHIAPVLAVLRRDVDNQAHYYLFTEFFKAPHSLRGVIMIMNRQFSYEEIKRLILMIVEGLYFLHSRKVPHGSLHTSNVMVHTLVNNPTSIQMIQLSDYALLRATEGSHYGSSEHFVAPEARVNVVYDDYKADIWSVGIIIYEILTLQEPPPSETVPDLPEDFAANNLIAVHEKFDVIMKFFYLCTDPDPDKRPTIEQLVDMCDSL